MPAFPRWSGSKFLAASGNGGAADSAQRGSRLSHGRGQRRGRELNPGGLDHSVQCAAPAAQSGAMSWTCPRCQQPVFFGEAWAEEGEKTGRVRAFGLHEDARSWPRCGPSPLFHLWGAQHSGGMELASRRHSPSSLGITVGGNRGERRAPCAWPGSARLHLVPHSREGELPGQELAPILSEM